MKDERITKPILLRAGNWKLPGLDLLESQSPEAVVEKPEETAKVQAVTV